MIRDRYIDCITHCSSDAHLLIGEIKTAVFDCGMAFCAQETIRMVQEALSGRQLDYVFMTHTHYDHIGALPFFRRQWPDVYAVTSEIGAGVLLKDTPRRVIRELSLVAASLHGVFASDIAYDDEALRADMVVREGDAIDLGGFTVRVLETPGHTRDALCYFITEPALLIANETPGVLMPDGVLYPCYLTGFHDTINSIKKLGGVPYKHLSLPHKGLVGQDIMDGYFRNALEVNTTCREFILWMRDKGLNDDEMMASFYDRYYNEALVEYQPKEAFLANAKATIACTLREA